MMFNIGDEVREIESPWRKGKIVAYRNGFFKVQWYDGGDSLMKERDLAYPNSTNGTNSVVANALAWKRGVARNASVTLQEGDFIKENGVEYKVVGKPNKWAYEVVDPSGKKKLIADGNIKEYKLKTDSHYYTNAVRNAKFKVGDRVRDLDSNEMGKIVKVYPSGEMVQFVDDEGFVWAAKTDRVVSVNTRRFHNAAKRMAMNSMSNPKIGDMVVEAGKKSDKPTRLVEELPEKRDSWGFRIKVFKLADGRILKDGYLIDANHPKFKIGEKVKVPHVENNSNIAMLDTPVVTGYGAYLTSRSLEYHVKYTYKRISDGKILSFDDLTSEDFLAKR